jgi:hypothetical protein
MGDSVFLRLRPYRQMRVALRRKLKLSPRYYGPFQVTQRINSAAYKLDMPVSSQIDPIFHVSNLKKKLGDRITHINNNFQLARPRELLLWNQRFC